MFVGSCVCCFEMGASGKRVRNKYGKGRNMWLSIMRFQGVTGTKSHSHFEISRSLKSLDVSRR
jgi:hypothetical protein